MRWRIVYAESRGGAALAQGGCGLADSRPPVREFMRARATEPIPPEPPPDVSRLLREQLDSVFIAASYPRQVQVSPPLHEPQGSGWTACVRAELISSTGQPLGAQTYRITISGGVTIDRRRAEADHHCAADTYH